MAFVVLKLNTSLYWIICANGVLIVLFISLMVQKLNNYTRCEHAYDNLSNKIGLTHHLTIVDSAVENHRRQSSLFYGLCYCVWTIELPRLLVEGQVKL